MWESWIFAGGESSQNHRWSRSTPWTLSMGAFSPTSGKTKWYDTKRKMVRMPVLMMFSPFRPDLSEEKPPTHYYRWVLMTLELLMTCDFIKLSFKNFEQVVCNDLRIADDFCDLIKMIFFQAEVASLCFLGKPAGEIYFPTIRWLSKSKWSQWWWRWWWRLWCWQWQCWWQWLWYKFSVKGRKTSVPLNSTKLLNSPLFRGGEARKWGQNLALYPFLAARTWPLFIHSSRPAGHVAK